jgi:oligosaccharide repeat unit polymerase
VLWRTTRNLGRMYPILLFASVAIFIIVTIVYLRQDFASLYHPISLYLAFHGLVFGIRPVFAYCNHYDFLYRVYRFNPSPDVKSTVLICANLGLLAFVAGAWKGGGEPLTFRQGPAEIEHRKRLIPAFLLVIALVAPIAVASIVTVYTQGYAGMRLDVHSGVSINTTSNGWLLEAQLMLVPLSVLVAWTFRFRWWSLLPLLLFVTVRAGTGGRGPFIVACVATGLLWMFDNKRRWPTLTMFALTVPLVAVFYILGQERGAVRTFLDDGKIIEVRESTGFMETMDWANMEFFEYLVETVPRKTGTYGLFIDNLQVFTEPIPRVLWSSKPIGAPIKMFNLFDYGNPIGMTYSLPGYGWMQLGYLGVALWCALWGYCLGAIYSWLMRGRQGNFQVALYFAFLPIFVIAFRDGGLLTIMRTGVFYLSPVLIWMWSARSLGIADPADPARPSPRRASRRGALPAIAPPPGRRVRDHRPSQEIVPRAWRGRNGLQRAE